MLEQELANLCNWISLELKTLTEDRQLQKFITDYRIFGYITLGYQRKRARAKHYKLMVKIRPPFRIRGNRIIKN
jgi:hypothetical protein